MVSPTARPRRPALPARRARHASSDFRKACRSWSRLHPSQVQGLPAKPRTCFEGPFGEVIRATGPMASANPFRFSTKYQDEETDLVYYPPGRYYGPSWGGWLSRDPKEEAGGVNLYQFVGNDPISYFDVLGFWRSRAGFTEHRQLTQASLNASAGRLLPCANRVLRILQDADDAQDQAAYLNVLDRHYNRPFVAGESGSLEAANRAKWHRAYTRLLTIHLAQFATQPCRRSLEELGAVSHFWQDYYAHAVHDRTRFAGNAFTGSPDLAGGPYWPSSYAGFWHDAEHPASWTAEEPPYNDAQKKVRWNGAIQFVAKKYDRLLLIWYKRCKCECDGNTL
jgi:RHS repeat-associated protein